MTHEGEGDTAKVGASSEAGDDRIGIFAGHLHLFLGLQTDDGLMQCHVVEHTSQRVLAVGRGGGEFYGLGDGCAQRAGMRGVGGDDVFARTGRHGRRALDGSAKCAHDERAVGFLLQRDLDLIDSHLHAEYLGGI